MLAMVCWATNAVAQTQAADTKSSPEIYQTLYLTNLTQENDANDLVKDLRNMLSTAKLMYVPSQSAISIRASAEDIALARKILSDLDKTKKIYRLTYTMTEKDSGKTIGVQHFSVIVASGSMSVLKQGSRVPVIVGPAADGKSAQGASAGVCATSTHSASVSSAIRIGSIRSALWVEPAAGITSSKALSETSQ